VQDSWGFCVYFGVLLGLISKANTRIAKDKNRKPKDPQPMKCKVAAKNRTNLAAHAIRELYQIPVFVRKKSGDEIYSGLPEIEFTTVKSLKAHHRVARCAVWIAHAVAMTAIL
jgi:hypothetical protein